MELSLGNVESIFGIIESIAVTVCLVGAWVAYRQWKDQKSERQIEYQKDFSSSIMENPDMAAFVHMIEREKSIGYEDGKFSSSEKERIVDFALCRLSNYVELKKSGLVSGEDFHFIDYVLKHTFENKEIQDYLRFLLKVVKDDKNAHPYKQLLEYGRERV